LEEIDERKVESRGRALVPNSKSRISHLQRTSWQANSIQVLSLILEEIDERMVESRRRAPALNSKSRPYHLR
jgi:hypothetical protein